jgi:hypothetical protein
MAKRRIITQAIICDEDFNIMPCQSRELFFRMIAISDDCGVLPGNIYTLRSLLNPPKDINGKFEFYLNEIIKNKLLIPFEYNNKPFLFFKQGSFEENQAYLIKNRTKSEYLKISVEDYKLLYNQVLGNFQKIPEITVNYSDNDSYHIESKEIKDKREKIKDKSKEIKEENLIPPKIEDLKEYFREKGFENETDKFFDFYTSKNWFVGKNKMKDWKAAVRNWIRNKDNFKSNFKQTKSNNQTDNNIFIYQIESGKGFINKSNINLTEIIKNKYSNVKTEFERLKNIPAIEWEYKKNLKTDNDFIEYMADRILDKEELESTRLNSNLKSVLINQIKKTI